MEVNAEIESFIYFSLQRAMNEKKMFLNCGLTLANLSRHLKTNRTYLSLTIRKNCNSSFVDYVNLHRVNEARKLLSDVSTKNYTLEAICKMAGFQSKSTFNNAFKKFVGLTPSEFRRFSFKRLVNQ